MNRYKTHYVRNHRYKIMYEFYSNRIYKRVISCVMNGQEYHQDDIDKMSDEQIKQVYDDQRGVWC